MSHGPIWYNKEKCIIPFRFYFWIQVRGGKKYDAIKLCVKKEENRQEGKRRKRSKIVSINGLQEVGLSDVLRTSIWEYPTTTNPMRKWQLYSWLFIHILGLSFCVVHFWQVLLRRLRRTTSIDGRDRFEHTLFTHRRWQPVLRTSVLGYCRQTQQLNHEHELSVVKATREIICHIRQKIYSVFGTRFFFFAIFCRPREISQHKPAVSAESWWRPYHVRCDVGDIVPPCALLGRLCQSKKRFFFVFPYEQVSFFVMRLARLSRYCVRKATGRNGKGATIMRWRLTL